MKINTVCVIFFVHSMGFRLWNPMNTSANLMEGSLNEMSQIPLLLQEFSEKTVYNITVLNVFLHNAPGYTHSEMIHWLNHLTRLPTASADTTVATPIPRSSP